MDIKRILSGNIRRRRKDLGLTQTDLAERTNLSFTTIQAAERDSDDLPSLTTITKLADFFSCDTGDLFQAHDIDAINNIPENIIEMLNSVPKNSPQWSTIKLALDTVFTALALNKDTKKKKKA